MYESKKQSAQRTIEKKDSKLQEIETVRSSFNFVFWLQYTAHCIVKFLLYVQLHGTYICCMLILPTINNDAFDVQCGSIECVQLNFFFLPLYLIWN